MALDDRINPIGGSQGGGPVDPDDGGGDPDVFDIIDSWVVSGGNWIVAQFYTRFDTRADSYWIEGETPSVQPESAGSPPISVSIKHVQLEYFNGFSVVTILFRPSRRIYSEEILKFYQTSLPIAQTADGVKRTEITDFYPRNLSGCHPDGGISLGLRVGSGSDVPFLDPLSPLIGATYGTKPVFYLRAQDAGIVNINNGIWTGSGGRMIARNGSMVKTNSDPDFNGNPSITLNAVEVGEFVSFAQGVVFIPPNPQNPATESFTHIAVIRTNTDFPSFNMIFGDIISPGVWGVGRYWRARTQGFGDPYIFGPCDNWLTEPSTTSNQGLISTTYRGNPKGRTHVIGVRWDHLEQTLHWFGPGGNIIDEQTITNVVNIQDSGLISVGTPSSPNPTFMGLRTSETVKLAELYVYNKALDWQFIQAHSAHLDQKYKTTAKRIYIDPESSSLIEDGTLTNPFKSYGSDQMFSEILMGSGDQILFAAGHSSGISMGAGYEIRGYWDGTGTKFRGSLGYSQKYPFVFGISGSVSDHGYYKTEFLDSANEYVNIMTRSVNVLIHGHSFSCPERDPSTSFYTGIVGLNPRNVGIRYNQQSYFDTREKGIQVIDCDIANCSKSGIVIREVKPSDETDGFYLKGSTIRRTSIHDTWNTYYARTGENPDIGISNAISGTPARGVTAIYCEGTEGLIVDECLFYRNGWQPGITSATLSGYLYLPNGMTGAYFSTTGDVFDELDGIAYAWTNESQYSNFQRAIVSSTTASVSSQQIVIGSTTSAGPQYFFIDPTQTTITPALGITASDYSVYFLDLAPRSPGNSDIGIGNVGNLYGTALTQKSSGPYVISNSVFLDSGGHNLLAGSNYLWCGNISENNPFSLVPAQFYTTITESFFGGTSGEMVRRTPSLPIYIEPPDVVEPPPPPPPPPQGEIPSAWLPDFNYVDRFFVNSPGRQIINCDTTAQFLTALNTLKGIGGEIILNPNNTFVSPGDWDAGGSTSTPFTPLVVRSATNTEGKRARIIQSSTNKVVRARTGKVIRNLYFADVELINNGSGKVVDCVGTNNRNWRFYGCKIEGDYPIAFEGDSPTALSEDLYVVACVLIPKGRGSHDQGMWVSKTRNVHVYHNFVHSKQWETFESRRGSPYEGFPTVFGHNFYLQYSNYNVRFFGNHSINAQATGAQCRTGGDIALNCFEGNPIGLLIGNEDGADNQRTDDTLLYGNVVWRPIDMRPEDGQTVYYNENNQVTNYRRVDGIALNGHMITGADNIIVDPDPTNHPSRGLATRPLQFLGRGHGNDADGTPEGHVEFGSRLRRMAVYGNWDNLILYVKYRVYLHEIVMDIDYTHGDATIRTGEPGSPPVTFNVTKTQVTKTLPPRLATLYPNWKTDIANARKGFWPYHLHPAYIWKDVMCPAFGRPLPEIPTAVLPDPY